MGGIGIALEEAADAHYGVRICGISPFSVAALSGRLALHDRIVAVNGVSCEGLSAFQVVSLLRDGAGPLLHVRVRPLLSNHASSEHVAWVLRVRADGPSDIPTLERYADSGSVGAVISEGDNEALWHVDHIKIGGAAWLAAEHASMQSTIHGETHVTLMEGDCIETVNGRSVRDTDAPAVLRGPWFTRIRLGVLRNGIPLAVDMVRSPVMEREHLRHALVYLSSLRQAFSMQHGNTDSWRPALPTDASQHAHTSPNHACREQDAAPNVTRVQAVAKMIHADLDKVLASLSSPSLRSSAGISERDEQSPGLASREVALDRVRAVLGTADAFKLKHTASHKHARLQSQTVNGQPTSLSSPAASRQETLLQEETSLDAPRVRVASRAGNPDTMPPAALQPYPLQHHAADPRFYGNVHDNGMRGEKEHLYGLAVQARKELERINAEHDRREHQQEGARQRVLNAMHEENEQLYGQMTQARRELERINTEYDRRMHEQEGEKQMNDRKAESIWPSVIQPAGFLAPSQSVPETMDGEERAEMRRDVHKLAQNVSPSLIQPFAFLAPSKRDDENVHAVHDGRAPLLSVQERGGKMHLEQALRSAEDAQKGTSFATGKSAYGHEFDIICQREQAVRAALGLENYESPAKGAAPFAATRSSTVVQEEQSLKTELEWAGRKLNNGGMALEPDGPTPRVLHAARTSSASNGGQGADMPKETRTRPQEHQDQEKYVQRALNMIHAGLSDTQILHHGALTESGLTLSQISTIRARRFSTSRSSTAPNHDILARVSAQQQSSTIPASLEAQQLERAQRRNIPDVSGEIAEPGVRSCMPRGYRV